MTKNSSNYEFGPDPDDALPEAVLEVIREGGSPLLAIRRWRGRTIEELARIAGVSEENIRAAEGGKELTLGEQVALARSLQVGVGLLVT